MYTAIYFHAKKDAYDVHKDVNLHQYAARVDTVNLLNGDVVGKVVAKSAEVRRILEAQTGVTVIPPLHRPITQIHVVAFNHVKANLTDTGYDVAEKLHQEHKVAWLHPEEWFI